MKSALATVTLPGDLRQKLEAIAAAGFDGVEIFEQDLIAYDAPPAEVGRMVRDLGLHVTLFQPFRDFEGLPEPLRSRAFARAQHKFDLMEDLGADLMLICSNLHPASLPGAGRAAQDLRDLADQAAARGLRLGYEALAWGRHVNDHREAWKIVQQADHPALGLILDSFHTLARGIDPDTIRAIPGDRIAYVHLADAPRIEMDLLYLSRHFRSMPGEGDMDVAGFLRAVLATGYDHVLSPEIFNDQFRGGRTNLLARDGFRAVQALLDAAGRAEPSLRRGAPLPPPAPVRSVEFVEFATSPGDEPALGAFLASAGFEPAGHHCSKPVTLWRQGNINLLVNTDPKGFAATAWAAHGTSVSEIALNVPDAGAALARARALGAEVWADDHRALGELAIPALRGVGGSLLRLVDPGPELGSLWQRDFVTTPAQAGVGLLAVDHVGQTMPHDEMLSWTLFYTTLFGAAKSPIVDVVDPGGLVRSQAIESGALRITLNGAETHRTVAGRFIRDSLGASVQHIAFSTADIIATADALAARGFRRLAMGANYYADLAARFGLAAPLLARLQSRDILYDEDDRGSFLQLYSAPRPDGFFVEIVQRLNGYAGYGAANAPYRTAAQRRVAQADGVPSR